MGSNNHANWTDPHTLWLNQQMKDLRHNRTVYVYSSAMCEAIEKEIELDLNLKGRIPKKLHRDPHFKELFWWSYN